MGALTPGTVLGGCRIEAVVGRGGMGIVYRARQLDLDRDVAVKVIAPELVEDPDSRKRFLTEARAAGAVEHPNVIPVHGAGVADGRAYLVMRYVDGDDLRTVVRRDGAVPPERAAWVVLQLGEALDAIHEAGYVHRDVKPQNVMIDADGHVYLSDFGLAKQAMASAGPTTSEQWVGTLDYVAPEQIRGERVDARADVYALGGVLYYMLTARVPFERESDHAKLWAHLVDEPPRPSAVRPDLPAGLDAVVARALAKDPARRQRSAGDLGRAARAAAAGERETAPERTVASGAAAPGASATTTPSPTSLLPARVRPRRRRALVMGALAAGAGVAALAVWLVPDRGGEQGEPPGAQAAATAKSAATPAGARVGATIGNVGRRPRAVVVAGGAVWVLSIHEPRITRLDVHSGRRVGEQSYVGRGAASIAADDDMVWVAKRATSAILGLDPDSGERLRRFRIPVPPARIAAGRSGLWVVARETDEGPASLLHYDRAGEQLLGRTEFADGIDAIALGAGAAWVALARTHRVVRVRPGEPADHAWLTEPASELAFGAGHVWASVPDDDSVARIDPHTLLAVTTDVGPRPSGLAVAGGHVFVASNTRHTVDVLDPRRMLRGPVQRLPVEPNPYAVAAGGGHVWVAGLGAGTLTRIDYRGRLP
jgi:DNA-binding beta-propeller fold protein YncE